MNNNIFNFNNNARLIHSVEIYLNNAATALNENGLHNLVNVVDNLILNFREPNFQELNQSFLNDVRNLSQQQKDNLKETIFQMINENGCRFMNDFLTIFNIYI